jgi:hypothetical protein
MDAPFESSAEEVARLRDCLTDLASIMALPASSTGGEPGQIVITLADALLGMLRVAFVCVRLNDPEGGPSIETMRIGDALEGTARTAVSFASARLGLHGELGIVVAGSWKPDFPADTERLLLDVAANQAAIGLQQASLLKQAGLRSEQKIMDTIPGLVAMLTPAGEVDVVNHELVEYCGQGLDAMKQWGTNGTVHADDLPRVGQVFTRRSRQARRTISRRASAASMACTAGVRFAGCPIAMRASTSPAGSCSSPTSTTGSAPRMP